MNITATQGTLEVNTSAASVGGFVTGEPVVLGLVTPQDGYSWRIRRAPSRSSAALDDAYSASPAFTPDQDGEYVLACDSTLAGKPSKSTITLYARSAVFDPYEETAFTSYAPPSTANSLPHTTSPGVWSETGLSGSSQLAGFSAAGIPSVVSVGAYLSLHDGLLSAPAQAMGGDVSGTTAAATVTRLQGNTVSPGSLTAGQVLRATDTASSAFGALDLGNASAVTGMLPAGHQSSQTMGGDVSGTTASATVSAIQGRAVSTSSPSAGAVLTWSGSNWAPSVPYPRTPLWVPLVSGPFSTSVTGSTPVVVGGAYLDPTTFSGFSGCSLEVLGLVSSNGLTGSLTLFNVTDNTQVAVATFTGLTASLVSASASSLAALSSSKHLEARLSVSSATASNSATVIMARLRFY